MWIRDIINTLRISYIKTKISKIGLSDDKKLIGQYRSLPKLNKDEKKRIFKTWGQILNKTTLERGLIYYSICKQLRGFDERYVPSSYYVPYICYLLNRRVYIPNFVHKSLFEIHFKNIKQPETIVKSIGGCYYDSKHNQLTREEVLLKLSSSTENLILKNIRRQRYCISR